MIYFRYKNGAGNEIRSHGTEPVGVTPYSRFGIEKTGRYLSRGDTVLVEILAG